MNKALFVVGGLALLLLFGCAGPAEQPVSEQPVPPSPDSNLGDADVSVEEEYDDGLLSDEELIPPLDEEETGPTEETGLEGEESSTQIEISDIFVEEGTDFDLISEEDIIEPI